MTDNVSLPASGVKAATRDVTYSGETAQAQAVGLVTFTGADDAKTATDVPAGGGTETTALRVTIANDSTGVLSVDDNGGSLTVDAPVGTPVFVRLSDGTDPLPASASGLFVVGAAAHDAAYAGNPLLIGGYASAAAPTDVAADGEAVRLWSLRNGAQVMQVSYGGILASVGNGASGTGVQRVTVANDSTGILAGVTTVTTLSTLTGGGVAHDSPDSGNPVKVGARAVSALSSATMVAAADRSDVVTDLDAALITKPYAPNADILVERVSDTGGTSTASTVFGATANARNCITTIAVYNDSTTGGYVDFRDGTAGTILFTLPLPAKGGAVTNFPLPLRQTTANTAFAYDVSAALTTVYISFIGFKSKA